MPMIFLHAVFSANCQYIKYFQNKVVVVVKFKNYIYSMKKVQIKVRPSYD